MRPRAPSTVNPSSSFRRLCVGCGEAGRHWWWRIGSRPSSRQTASSCSTSARWSRPAPMNSCSPRAASTPTFTPSSPADTAGDMDRTTPAARSTMPAPDYRLADDGTPYRDLNSNGEMDVYEDPRRPAEERVDDLLGRL